MDAGKITSEQVQQMQKDGYLITNLSSKKEDEGEVLCKMAIKGKATKLKNIMDSILSSYYASPYTANNKHYPEVNPELKLTMMIEKVKESE
jgi:hypothetical protein